MPQLADLTLKDFLDQLAAKQPTPGGGSASAIGGALGTALASMAANYTIGNEKFQEAETEVKAAAAALEALRAKLVLSADEDVSAYQAYRAAKAMPKDLTEEKAARLAALAAAREEATRVPEEILRETHEGMRQVEILSRTANPNLAGDIASAAYFLEACARGAAMQVFSNCTGSESAARRQAAQAVVGECQSFRETIHGAVLRMLKIEK